MIQLKSEFDLLPGSFTSLNIDVEEENLSIYGLIPPKLIGIISENSDGIYGHGDLITINLEFTAEVDVTGIPTLTMNTGCHSNDCFIPEIQSFYCAAELGSFAIQFDDQYLMTIDSNLTQDQFKYKLESIQGIDEVTISYSNNKYINTNLNTLCASNGNTIQITYEKISFQKYDGDLPELILDRYNWLPNPRSGLSQGNVEERLRGRKNNYEVILNSTTKEIQKGKKQSDSLAYYSSGSGTKTITFQYIVRQGDFVENLNVISLNFNSGYISSSITGENISTIMPEFGSSYRYLDSNPSSLTHNNFLQSH